MVEEKDFKILNEYLKTDLECRICLEYSDDIFECSNENCLEIYCKSCLIDKLKAK